jgi:predicted nucleic acid-binding Zn ribbon protein
MARSLDRRGSRPEAAQTGARDAGATEGAVRPARGGRPRLLGEALPALLETLGVAAPLEDARIFAHWAEIVGPEIARVARPHRLDAGTLIVHVKSSPWMAELSLRRSELLARVNAGRERRSIRQIVFRLEVGVGSAPDAKQADTPMET